ncbi:MAG: hypothetical protein IPH76_18695 [Xanthomonadales bacterium]|nr:hypothetical protein [Xanthomonadales bacterium]
MNRLHFTRWLFPLLAPLLSAPLLAADYVVTTIADSGAGSLRQAVMDANGDGGPSTITFDALLDGQTIAPSTPFPDLAEAGTTIDGDRNSDCVPDIAIDGSALSNIDGLHLTAPGQIIRGLSIQRFRNGLYLDSDASTVTCNHIGTNAAQATGFGNTDYGVAIYGSDNVIGPDNVISHNGWVGVLVHDSMLPGYPEFTALTADHVGIYTPIAFDAPDDALRHIASATTPLDGSGHPFTDHFGMRLRGELVVSDAGSYTFTVDPLDDEVRVTVDAGLVVSGNGPGPLSGSISLTPGAHTIRVDYVEYSGGAQVALAIAGPGSATLSTNAQALCATGQPGLCAELFQLRNAHERNRITRNRIADNGDLGIQLRCCGGPLPNDAGDTDLGANTWLNRPEFTGIASAGGGNYTLSGTAPPGATVEVFIAVADPSGAGEAGSFLADTVATPGGTFSLTLPLPAQPSLVTATATDPLGNTSEFADNLAYGTGADVVSVSGGGVIAGTPISVPIHLRDLGFTPLGRDRAVGERIQGLALRVTFPAGSISAAIIVPAGITAALAPLFGPTSSFGAGNVSYLVAYEETGNLIPLTLDAAAPGDVVATLNLTVAADQPSGTLPLDFDLVSELSNQAGTLAENAGTGTLQQVGSTLAVTGNGPSGLFAIATSASTVHLSWFDPNLVETGFRIERSTDGSTYLPVIDLGPDVTSHDDSGLAQATLYYYRVRSLVGGNAGGVSNRATASTAPAIGANVCVDAQVVSRRWARSPDAAYRGPEWGLVYHDRDDGTHEQVYFQRIDGSTLAPIGPRVQVSTSATTAFMAAIGYNGNHYALTWIEALRGAPGSFPASELRFAELDGNGQVLRQPRRIQAAPPVINNLGANEVVRPHWDGSHWALFAPGQAVGFVARIDYFRLAENGDRVLGPVTVANAADAWIGQPTAAWQPASSELGLAWLYNKDALTELRFQRVEESTGVPLLAAPAVLDAVTDASGIGGTDLVAMPGGGWLAAWSACADATGECLAYTRRIAADGTPDPGGRVSISPPGSLDYRLRLAPRPGGYVLLLESWQPVEEIVRYHLDANGAPLTGPTAVSAFDSRRSGRPRMATDGARALLLWNEANTTLEVAGRLSDGVSGNLDPEVWFTSGHDTANTAGVVTPGQPRVVSMAGGFASFWTEPVAGTNQIHGQIHDAAGNLAASFAPLSTSAAARPGVAAVGNTVALAWRVAGGTLRFMRLAGDGTVLLPETTVLSGVGTGNVELGWDGEQFGVTWGQGGSLRYARINEAGVAGTPITLALGLTQGFSGWRTTWMGDGWGLLLVDASDGTPRFARFASDGSILLAPTPLSAATTPPYFTSGDLGLDYDGSSLAVTWSEVRGADPPGQDIYFTTLNRDGSKVFPEVALVATPYWDGPAQLHHGGGRFHLVYAADIEGTSGLREIDIDLVPGSAVVAGSRFLANRASASIATAHDGATLALAWRAPQTQDIHFQTDRCLADPTPPPCPAATVRSAVEPRAPGLGADHRCGVRAVALPRLPRRRADRGAARVRDPVR